MPSNARLAREHREWLRRVVAQTGLRPSRIASEIKVAPSTLTRPLREGDEGTSTLHASTIEKISAFTGIAPPGGVLKNGRRPARGLAEDATPYEPAAEGDAVAAAVRALIAGRNSIVAWTLRTRALELAGFLPGDVVLVDLNARAQSGDLVCAQIYDWQNMRAETVMRVLERASPVDLLLARTLDPELQTPVVVDGERVMVKGVLLPHRLRPTPAAA